MEQRNQTKTEGVTVSRKKYNDLLRALDIRKMTMDSLGQRVDFLSLELDGMRGHGQMMYTRLSKLESHVMDLAGWKKRGNVLRLVPKSK